MTARRPIVRRLLARGFRSLRHVVVDFDNPTFLVGQNGAGKSNVVDALAFLGDVATIPLDVAFEKRGGTSVVWHREGTGRQGLLELGVLLGPKGSVMQASYRFTLKPSNGGGYRVLLEHCRVQRKDGSIAHFSRSPVGVESSEEGMKPLTESSALVLPLIGGHTAFSPVVRALRGILVYTVAASGIRVPQDDEPSARLKADGSNCANVLLEIQRRKSDAIVRLAELLGAIVPGIVQVRPKSVGGKLTIEFVQEWGESKKRRLELDASSMSDGTLRALAILTVLFQKARPSVLAMEEPEAHLHASALPMVIDALRGAAADMQVLIATQSADVLDSKWVEDRHLRVVTWNDGQTRVGKLADYTRAALHEHIMGAGELQRARALEVEPRFPDEKDTEVDIAT